jgi:ornithine carbamoyltransferase
LSTTDFSPIFSAGEAPLVQKWRINIHKKSEVTTMENSTNPLYGRHLLTLLDFTPEEIHQLLDLAARLQEERRSGKEKTRLQGKAIALIFEKDSTRTRCAFELGAAHQGAWSTYLGPKGTHIGSKESIADTARVLGGMFDAIQYRGFGQNVVEELAKHAGVPVYNGLTDQFHPTQILADFLTMKQACDKPLNQQALVYLGDGANNMANSLMVGSAKMGIDFRLACPESLRPEDDLIEKCRGIAQKSGGRITLSDSPEEAVMGADFLCTDVWLSMGQPKEEWDQRLKVLMPYRVDSQLMKATGNPEAKFLHCLPAYHDRNTPSGEEFFKNHGLTGIEVSDDVFESKHSVVFAESENRLHTIKALMVATLCQNI